MRRRSRLFRSVVVFGSSLGAATIVGTGVSAMTSGCDMQEGSGQGSGPWGIIDAAPPDVPCGGDAQCDAWWGFIDAAVLDGNWGTIADAPNDAPHATEVTDAKVKP